MTSTTSKIEQAAEWLANYLSGQPEFRADSAAIKSRATEAGINVRTLEHARARLGVTLETGSAPGRPFVSWWRLPLAKTTGVNADDLADAVALIRAVGSGDIEGQRAVLVNARPTQTVLATAMLAGFLAESKYGTLDAGLQALRSAVDGWVGGLQSEGGQR